MLGSRLTLTWDHCLKVKVGSERCQPDLGFEVGPGAVMGQGRGKLLVTQKEITIKDNNLNL